VDWWVRLKRSRPACAGRLCASGRRCCC